jgi:DNA-directed RNA polymerase subunit RPC12/RpoP
MKHPSFRCAACGSHSLRRSHRHSLLELPKMVTGQYPFRCNECHHRFFINVWFVSKLKVAKCPHCLSLKLTEWPDDRRHRTRPWQKLMILFGANRYRCSACRTNFVSFRNREARLTAAAPGRDTSGADAQAHQADLVSSTTNRA